MDLTPCLDIAWRLLKTSTLNSVKSSIRSGATVEQLDLITIWQAEVYVSGCTYTRKTYAIQD